ncbi:hypothetical protein R3W88_010952 [Solanum pinnatisectum]|uniref:Protein TIC 214 n=1 Tax=Solanum pinnatisectum TaxID=50273 RepID=A0AAV9L5G9_9SOLN|nr:hypothetical protein R3W88_010952 [Solanum pinnatisectum]
MLEAQKKNKEDVKTSKKISEKDQEGSSKNILHDKRMQKTIHGKFESLTDDRLLNNPNLTLKDNNIGHTCLYPLLHVCEDQKNSFEEEFPNQQQEDIDGESELNKVTCEDDRTDNYGRILNDNTVNYGSKLLTRDEKDGNYHITKEIPRSTKFQNSNMNYLTNEDSNIKTNKMSVGCERKDRKGWRKG